MRVRIQIEITGNYLVEHGKDFEVTEYFEITPHPNKEEMKYRKEGLRQEIKERVEQLLEIGGI